MHYRFSRYIFRNKINKYQGNCAREHNNRSFRFKYVKSNCAVCLPLASYTILHHYCTATLLISYIHDTLSFLHILVHYVLRFRVARSLHYISLTKYGFRLLITPFLTHQSLFDNSLSPVSYLLVYIRRSDSQTRSNTRGLSAMSPAAFTIFPTRSISDPTRVS